MANDSSLQGSATHFAFDLDSQKGVTQLLAAVRASEINPEQKNELRDLIFLYANGGKDQSVRFTLEQKISTYGIVPLVPEPKPPVAEVEKAKPAFGTSRPAPSFMATAKVVGEVTPPAAPTPLPKVEEVVATSESVETAAQIQAEVPISVHEPEPVVSASVPPMQSEPEPPASTPTPIAATPAAKSISYDPNQALLRIREIKSLVNDKVGNPVNLVDINNEVGREYMGALLDAMKKLNSGTSVISAMKRLETAYELVEKTIAEHSQEVEAKVDLKPAETIPPVMEVVTPPEEKVPEPPVEELLATVEPEKTPSTDTERRIPIVPTNDFVPVPTVGTTKAADQLIYPAHPNNLPTAQAEMKVSSSPVNVPMPRPEPVLQESRVEPTKSPAPVKEKAPESGIASAWGSETDTILPGDKQAIDSSVTGKASSLAQAKIKPRTPNDLPLASSLETSSVAGDPLYTKQVDEGLEQLLLEWSLFKKSGLFGTGPKGREHPLFKKMVGLQIPLLLAGRFEGATQEIKQSITDYMNGWRYEQGIVYEQGETFEHYLRRVIRHILDLQLK